MKTSLPLRNSFFAVILFAITPFAVQSQQSLEFTAGAANPTGSGPTVASQVITFQANNNNPNGNTFIPFSPTVTASFSFSNQQYTAISVSDISTGTGMSFGANANNNSNAAASSSLFAQMNAISSPSSNHFTAVATGTAGTGIDVSANRAVSLFNSSRPLYTAGLSTSGRYYYGDLTISFSKPVINPVLHLVGLGGYFTSSGNTLGFTTELELATVGMVLSKISGSSELEVTNSKILNNASHPNAGTGAGAASGSVKVTGLVSTIKFKVYLRGDGGNSNWTTSSMHTGDLWMMGVSMGASTDLPLPVTMSSFTATLNNNKADLRWTTATEINVSHFVIEKSTDGSNFSDAGILFATGNTTEEMKYTFSDNLAGSVNDVIWYRIRTVDNDGSFDYSATRIIRISHKENSTVIINTYPNPVKNEVRITVPANWQNKMVVYEMISLSGQVVKRVQTANSSQTESLQVTNLAPGMYIARVSCEGQVAQQKIVKQ